MKKTYVPNLTDNKHYISSIIYEKASKEKFKRENSNYQGIFHLVLVHFGLERLFSIVDVKVLYNYRTITNHSMTVLEAHDHITLHNSRLDFNTTDPLVKFFIIYFFQFI